MKFSKNTFINRYLYHLHWVFFLVFLLMSGFEIAVAQLNRNSLYFEGSLVDANSNPVNLSNQPIDFFIVNSVKDCYIYRETSNSAGDVNGQISHRIGSLSTSGTSSINQFTSKLFSQSVSGTTTSNGTTKDCTFDGKEDRFILISVDVGGGNNTIELLFPLTTMPYALHAQSAGDEIDRFNTSTLRLGVAGDTLISIGNNKISWYTPQHNDYDANSFVVNNTGGVSKTLTLANTGVLAGTYGDSANIPQISVDAFGRITSVGVVAASGGGATITAGTGLSLLGNQMSVNVGTANGQIVQLGTNGLPAVNASQLMSLNANNISTGTLSASRLPAFTGDVTSVAGNSVLTLSDTGVTSGSYYRVMVDSKGRVTAGSALSSADITTALGYTPAKVASATQWVTSGTTINYNTGNVGIGTTNPSYKLSLGGTNSNDKKIGINSTQALYLPDQVSLNGSIAVGDGLNSLSNSSGNDGRYNTSVGISTLRNITTGFGNTAHGYSALTSNTTGDYNVAIGSLSLSSVTSGGKNVAIGGSALFNATGSNNIAIGHFSGLVLTTGSNNVIIGSYTGADIATSSNNIVIADGAGTERIRVNSSGKMGIGIATPEAKLHVDGDIVGKSNTISTASPTSVDFSTGNLQAITSSGCGGASGKTYTLQNIKNGGTYQLVIQNTTEGGVCSFAVPAGFELKDAPVNTEKTLDKHILFSFTVINSKVYLTSIDGY